MTKCVLGDVAICHDNRRVPLSAAQRANRKGPYRYYGAQVVIDHIDDYLFDGEYLLIAEDGENLRSQKQDIANLASGKFWVNNHAHIIQTNDACDLRYLKYLLNLTDISGYVTGSAQPKLSQESMMGIRLSLPDISDQRKISAVLSAVEDKIALNRKRIATLEAMAKEIYDYWFVQFDFPDAHGRPYKSSGGAMVYNPDLKREIPKEWEVCRIGDHITANRGISYSTKNISSGNGVPMINLNSFNVDSSYKVKGIKMFDGEIPSTRRIAPYDLVMCNTQQTDLDPCKDIIGKSFLVPDIFEGTIVSSHHVTTIHVDDDNLKVYLNALFHTREFHAYIAGYASGTSIRGLNFLGVENCYIAVPYMPLLSKFANLALSCEKEKSRILRNQKMLQTLRDFILPLLMNGQTKVG